MRLPWMLQRETWRSASIALRRVHRDRQARRFCFFLLSSFAYVAFYFHQFFWPLLFAKSREVRAEAVGQFIMAAVILTGGLAVFGFRFWLERRDRVPSIGEGLRLQTSIRSFPKPVEITVLLREARILTALLTRAAHEAALPVTASAQDEKVLIRRWLLDQLRLLGVWESMPAASRNLLLLPNGHWTPEQQENIHSLLQSLLALRWALGVDNNLQPLDRMPAYTKDFTSLLFDNSVVERISFIDSWEIRAARDIAIEHAICFWIEAVKRNLIEQKLSPEEFLEVCSLSERSHGTLHSSVPLVGMQEIQQLSDAVLITMYLASVQRREALALLTEIAVGDQETPSLSELLPEYLYHSSSQQVEVK